MANYKVYKPLDKGKLSTLPSITSKEITSAPLNYELEVLEEATKAGAGNVAIYTVPDNYILWITNVGMSSVMSGAATITAYSYMRMNAIGTTGRTLMYLPVPNQWDGKSIELRYSPPLKLEEGKSIYLLNNNAGQVSFGIIRGFLELKQSRA